MTTISEILEAQSLTSRTLSFDITIGEIISIYQQEELIIAPEFQRLFRWSAEKQSQFVESLLLEFPIPPIFVIENSDGIYELIDGLQRITTILRFFGVINPSDELPVLEGCDLVPELNGMSSSDLPLSERLKIKRTPLRMIVVKRNSKSHIKFEIFRRLNTGGVRLSDQEIRNCIMRIIDNNFNAFLIQMSQYLPFVTCIDSVSEDKIMEKYDQELVLRFFAFKNSRNSFRHDIGEFLTDYMRDISEGKLTFDYENEERTFKKTFSVLERILGEDTFCGVNKRGNFVKQFRVNFFEAFALGIQPALSRWNDQGPWDEELIERYEKAFKEIRVDSDFLKYTGGGSNTKNMLNGRIQFVEDFLRSIPHD